MARVIGSNDHQDLCVTLGGRRAWHVRKAVMDGTTQASDSNDGFGPNTAKLTVAGVTPADGDEIVFGPGTWNEAIDLSSVDVRLRGAGRQLTLFNNAAGAITIGSGELIDLGFAGAATEGLQVINFYPQRNSTGIGYNDLRLVRVNHRDFYNGSPVAAGIYSSVLGGDVPGGGVFRAEDCNFFTGAYFNTVDWGFCDRCYFGLGNSAGSGAVPIYGIAGAIPNGTLRIKDCIVGGYKETGNIQGVYFETGTTHGSKVIFENVTIDLRSADVTGGPVYGMNFSTSIEVDHLDVYLNNVQIYVPPLTGCKQIVADSKMRFHVTGNTNLDLSKVSIAGSVVFRPEYHAMQSYPMVQS
jgi:hypothetical protein